VTTIRSLDYALLQQCMHCGMCLPTCPTYVTTKRERNSPRGRIALMRAVADGTLAVNRQFAEEMSYCLGCLACQTACPAGVQYGVLFEAARSDIETAHAQPGRMRALSRALSLGFLFLHPRALRAVGRLLGLYQRSGAESLVRQLGLTRVLPASLRRLEPQTPAIARRFSSALIEAREAPEATARVRRAPQKYRVALLTGCVQDLVFPDVNRDTADVLLANGCAVETPAVQPCCGSLHAHNGELDLAKTLARRLIDLFPPDRYDAIISNAGGCGSHLRHYAPLLAGDEAYAARARAWDAKLRDVQEWLVDIGFRAPTVGPFETPTSVTYHESCHLTHGQKIVRQPRSVLRQLPGVSLVELAESSWCCGAAGIYAISQPDQAALLLDRKVGHITATHATVVATANPGCQLQIARGLAAQGIGARVVHPVSLLAEAYRREARSPATAGSILPQSPELALKERGA
jgi:glycolate oxidase iron-sulfur subunit